MLYSEAPIPQPKKTKIQRDKTRLFKKLQELDRKISKLDESFYLKYSVKVTGPLWEKYKEKRDKLDQMRAKARIERKNYGRTTTN